MRHGFPAVFTFQSRSSCGSPAPNRTRIAACEPQLAVKADQTAIKGAVEVGRQTNAVPWVEPLFWELTPRQDMTRNQ